MKRFITAVVFCLSLLVVLPFVFVRSSRAKEDIIQALLDLPAPPPPNPLSPPPRGVRDPAFYDRKNPPRDDAPIEDLLDYWKHQSESYRDLGYNIYPSERATERMLAEIKKEPSSITEYIKIFKGSERGAEAAKEAYDSLGNDPENRATRTAIKEWLKYNSPYFTADLARGSDAISDANEYVTNQDDLLSLGRYDWERAHNVVNKLYGDNAQPTAQVLAKWALYRHALDENSMGDVDRYRDELKAVVENRSATGGQRDLALDALLKEKDWSGRDDWYFSLFEDETLGDLRVQGRSYTGLTTLMYYSPPGKYADKMIELVASKNPAVRAAVVRNLSLMIDAGRPEVVRALLPWLEDPKWARDIDGTRLRVVQALKEVKLPESVSGLLAVLDEKVSARQMVLPMAATNTNSAGSAVNIPLPPDAVVSSNMITNSTRGSGFRMADTYPYRSAAIEALGKQADIRAAGALRRVFNQIESYQRYTVIAAIMKCNGFSIPEQVDALESRAAAYREYQSAMEAAMKEAAPKAPEQTAAVDEDGDPVENSGLERTIALRNVAANVAVGRSDLYSGRQDMKSLLGDRLLSNTDEVTDELASAVITRIGELEKSDPSLAEVLRSAVNNWKSRFIYAFLLGDLKAGKASAGTVIKLLANRKQLRETQGSDVSDVRKGGPTAAGFAACLDESDSEYAEILADRDIEAKKSMLACGRLIRARLPVGTVASLLQSTDKQLSLAAERYLESEDSPEARRIVLSLHSNEAKILGATVAFAGSSNSIGMVAAMGDLFSSVGDQRNAVPFGEYGGFYSETKTNDWADGEKRLQKEVIANVDLLGIYAYGDSFVRIYKDKAVFSWEEDTSRYHERALEPGEFDELKSYLARHNVDELPPFLSCDAGGACESKELVMLSKYGGRRVYFRTSKPSEFAAGLDAIIDDLKQQKARLHYWLEKDVPGLEIVLADENLAAQAIWKNGSDFRVLIADKVREKNIEREIDAAADQDDSETPVEAGPDSKIYELQEKRKFDHVSWRQLSGGSLGDIVPQPADAEYIPLKDSIVPAGAEGQWKARTGAAEIRGSGEGLFKIVAGRAVQIGKGGYTSPVVSTNGKWAIADKSVGDELPSGMVRVNLITGRELKIAGKEAEYASPIAYVASVDRFLIGVQNGREEYDDSYSSGSGEGTYYWLNPETGVIQPATGDMRPLGQQHWRSLQPASGAFEFWAAIPNYLKNQTVIGIYSTRTFKMTPVLKLPKIQFNSQALWVDEAASKAYFIYDGHLLATPFRR